MARFDLGRWVSAFVPARLAHDDDLVRRSRILIVGTTLMALASIIGFAIRYAVGFGGVVTWVGGVGTSVLFAITPLVLRVSGSLRFATVLPALAGTASMTVVAAYDGGLGSASLIGLPAVPLFATFLAGPRVGVGFALLAVVSLVVLGALQTVGMLPPRAAETGPWMEITASAVVLTFVSGLAWIFERERRIVESRLRESERRYALAVEGAGEGLFDWNAKDGTVFYATGFRALVGNVPLDPAHPFPRAFVHEDDLAAVSRAVMLALGGRARLAVEARLRTDRGYRWFLIKGESEELQGRRGERLVGAIQDVHARKESDRVREEIVAIVSHELRTPLTSVYGAIRLLAREAAGMPAEAARLVTLAERNAERLLALVNDLLDLKRIEEGRLTLQPEPTDLATFARSMVEAHAELATKQEIGLVFGRAEGDTRVFIDPSRMEQVLVNLISNAIKFAEPKSEVVVSVERRAANIRLSVANRGEPVEPEARDRIFAKFGQMDSSTRRRRSGTGLGLAIAKAIVDAHRGVIGYTSEDGWTTFHVDLPAP